MAEPETTTVSGGRPEASTFAAWLQKKVALMALLKSHRHRRNLLSIWLTSIRRALTWKFWVLLLTIPSLIYTISPLIANTPALAFDVVQLTIAAASIAIGATLFAADRRQGTFDLLWLSMGSEKEILWLRQVTAAIPLFLLTLACVATLALHPLGDEVDLLKASILTLITSWTMISLSIWVATRLPQAWTAALFTLVMVGVIYWYGRESSSMLYPFINPFSTTDPTAVVDASDSGSSIQIFRRNRDNDLPGTGALVMNSIVMLLAAFFFGKMAAKRLR